MDCVQAQSGRFCADVITTISNGWRCRKPGRLTNRDVEPRRFWIFVDGMKTGLPSGASWERPGSSKAQEGKVFMDFFGPQ